MAIEVAERFADGKASVWQLGSIGRTVEKKWLRSLRSPRQGDDSQHFLTSMVTDPVLAQVGYLYGRLWGYPCSHELALSLFHDLFRYPFRDIVLAPPVLSPTVTSLAVAAYEERDSATGALDRTRLAILADALEETGCPEEVIGHLRAPGPHVRGCWVVDSLTGRE